MKRFIAAAAVAAAAFGLAACDVDQTEEGEMPDVDIEGGNLPKYDVTAPDVDVGTKETTVEVPTLDVKPAEDAEGKPATGNEE